MVLITVINDGGWVGNHPAFIMNFDRKKFPYTPAWHIFHTGFPAHFRRIDIIDQEVAHNMAYTMPLVLGRHDKEDYMKEEAAGYLTIAQMVEMFDNGCSFSIAEPKLHAVEIKHLLHFHLQDWSDSTNFIGIKSDLEGLNAMRRFYTVIEIIVRDAHGSNARIARSEFAAALDNMASFGMAFGVDKAFSDVFGSSPVATIVPDHNPAIDAVANGKNVFLSALLDQ